MKVIPNSRKKSFFYLYLLVFLLIAYLPLSSFLFALKNDALTANFPNKYFFSAALQAGYLPVWNPYINFGLPLYADPGFAFWNPITWFFGLIGYTVPLLTVEILFYIWLAGIFTFELGRWLGHSNRVSFCMGMMYMCCGFFVGNLQHINFLTCAAFLPVVVKTWLDIHKSFTLRKLFFCELALYMMATGGHPAIPFACVYFIIFLQIAILIFDKSVESKKKILIRSVKINLCLLAGFLLLASPLIYSYVEIYSRFTRSASVIQVTFSDTGFDPSSYLSFIFPFSTTALGNFFHNDPLMRNGYFSLVGLICLIVVLLRGKNNMQKVFLLAGTGMLILSMGGKVKEFLYPLLPLLDHIRTNGEFRVFSLLSFIIVGSFVLSELLEGRFIRQFNIISLMIFGISILIVILEFWFFATPEFWTAPNSSNNVFISLKKLLNQMNFSERISINAVVILLLLGLFIIFRRKYKVEILLPLLIMADLIVFNWMQLPITGVQILRPSTIQHYFSGIEKGIPIPNLEPIISNQSKNKNTDVVVGCWSYFSKQPGTPFQCSYPSILYKTKTYFDSSLPDSINQKAFVFTRHEGFSKSLKIISFTPSEINIKIESEKRDSLLILQNQYSGWKASVNEKSVAIGPAAIAFMAIPLEPGLNRVRLYFKNGSLLFICIFDILAWILATIILLGGKKWRFNF